MDNQAPGKPVQSEVLQDPGAQSRSEPFARARDNFLLSLSPEDRQLYSPCATSKDLTESLGKLDSLARAGIKKLKWLTTISSFASCFEPFLQVVDVFVSSNPQYAALCWGALRLVLQLASSFSTFFDKFMCLLERLTISLPQYEAVLDIHKQQRKLSPALLNIVQVAYGDILQLFHAAVRVFTKANGRIKKTPALIGELLWRPFDTRFRVLLQTFEDHKRVLVEELIIWSTRQNLQYFDQQNGKLLVSDTENALTDAERTRLREERFACQSYDTDEPEASVSWRKARIVQFEAQYKEKALRRIQHWLCPPDFANTKEASADLHEAGTCNPGVGKTILASVIIDHLLSSETQEVSSRREVYYYFFQYYTPASSLSVSAYRSILAQFLWTHRNDTDALDRFCLVMDEQGHGQPVASPKALLDLLCLCLGDNCILVLDGIDECSDHDFLIRDLLRISATKGPKILGLSRIHLPRLKRAVPSRFHLEFPKLSASQDIRVFCLRDISELLHEEILPKHAQGSAEELADCLVRGADGMFLWARLMADFLRLPVLTPEQRLRSIRSVKFPEGLEKMYERILSVIAASGCTSIRLASKALNVLAHAVLPLSSAQIQNILDIDGAGDADTSASVAEFEETILMACAGLVERAKTDASFVLPAGESSLRLIHLSVREMLQKKPELAAPTARDLPRLTDQAALSLPDPVSAHFDLANSCLRQLLYNTPAQPLAGKVGACISAHELHEKFGLTDYAAVVWLLHLQKGIEAAKGTPQQTRYWIPEIKRSCSALVLSLSIFLRNPRVVSVWLESFYTATRHRQAASQVHPPSDSIRNWCDWTANQERFPVDDTPGPDLTALETFRDFSNDLDRLRQTWSVRLLQSPAIIWDEMTSFVKTAFFFSPESTNVLFQDAEKPGRSESSDKAVATISQTSTTGDVKGVLSIWPPKLFHTDYLRSKWQDESLDLRLICTDWVAVYEVWSLQHVHNRVARIEICIEPSSMVFTLRNYLEGRYGEQIHFPLAISPDVTSFTVMRRLYALRKGPCASEARCLSHTLPFCGEQNYDFLWNKVCRFEWVHGRRLYTFTSLFCPNGRYVVLHEEHETCGLDTLTVTRCSTSAGLHVQRVRSLRLPHTLDNLGHLSFHPSLPLLVYYHVEVDPRRETIKKGWRLWPFLEDTEPLFFPLANEPRAVNFSGCGKFVVVEQTSGPLCVIPIDPSVLDMASSKQVAQAQDGDNVQQATNHSKQMNRFAITTEGTEALAYPVSGTQLSHSWQIDRHGESVSTRVAVTPDTGEVQLRREIGNGGAVQTVKLVVLPMFAGADKTFQRVFVPQHDNGILRITSDIAPQALYSLKASDPLFEAVPMVIERDVRFVEIRGGISALLDGSGEAGKGGSDERSRRLLGKRRRENEDDKGKE